MELERTTERAGPEFLQSVLWIFSPERYSMGKKKIFGTIYLGEVVYYLLFIYLFIFFFSNLFYFFKIIIIIFIVVDFVIHWNETAMGLHVFPTGAHYTE